MISERFTIDKENDIDNTHMHLSRYEFANKYVEHMNVLDIACGSGFGTAMLKKGGALHVLGIDVSEDAIEYAKAHYLDNEVEFKVGRADSFSSSGQFDAIVSFETIEHLYDPHSFLREIKSALRPEGFLIISTPAREGGALTDKPTNPFHVQEWSVEEFKELLLQYFPYINLWGQYNFHKMWFPFSRKFQRLRFRMVFPDSLKFINNYPVLSRPPTFSGFKFNVIYTVAVCTM